MYGKLQFHPIVEQFLSRLPDDSSLGSSVREAARCLGVSASHLQHLLKQETGRTYGEFVRANRADRARELLIFQPHRIISEIAYQLGVAPQTLTRDFLRAFGCSPAEFRRRQRGADIATTDPATVPGRFSTL
jgi:AraC-like DNA-binding protein